MRIKIIGENNCARATRHLLRMAGFAVTEFLPAEAITQAPHHGYAITIETGLRAPHVGGVRSDLSPAKLTPDASRKTLEVTRSSSPENRDAEGEPTSSPDLSTHGQPASTDEGASALAKAGADASLPAFGPKAGATAGHALFSSTSGTLAGGAGSTGFSLCGVGEGAGECAKEKGRQASQAAEKVDSERSFVTGVGRTRLRMHARKR
jgi:hypothetical protein